MSSPYENLLNPTMEELYEDLNLEYFISKTEKAFPSILAEKSQFHILIEVMAWAVARSYRQPRILRYLYNPDLVIDSLLPRLADTLNFQYPLGYPLDQLRVLIKYLQKIRRTRGTWTSVRQLLRLLEIGEEDILNLSFADYTSIDIFPVEVGSVYIRYNRIKDFDFANKMLELVMPAGYKWQLESAIETAGLDLVYRNRYDTGKFRERVAFGGEAQRTEASRGKDVIFIQKYNQPLM